MLVSETDFFIHQVLHSLVPQQQLGLILVHYYQSDLPLVREIFI